MADLLKYDMTNLTHATQKNTGSSERYEAKEPLDHWVSTITDESIIFKLLLLLYFRP